MLSGSNSAWRNVEGAWLLKKERRIETQMTLSNQIKSVLAAGSVLVLAASGGNLLSAQNNRGGGGPPQSGRGGGAGEGGPTSDMLKACEAKGSGDTCTADGNEGTCFAPRSNLPLACVPENGRGDQGGRGQRGGGGMAQSNTGMPVAGTQAYTLGVACSHSVDSVNASLGLPSKVTWTCERGQRKMTANSIPMHSTGQFPNLGNPSRVSPQSVSMAVTTSPIALSGPGGRVKEPAVALNGVKFDPGTAARCEDTMTDPSQCDLGRGTGRWAIEALGQDVFDFGEDENNAHVQPTGHYHYHGVPEGMLTEANRRGEAMQLIGWAKDGFPIYARYGYASPMAPLSGYKAMTTSYRLKSTPDKERPSTALVPMGTFTNDWEYVAGSGDLDECNGRFGTTPEFPDGIYHYYATDAFPYVQRCVKGSVESSPRVEQRGAGRGGEGRGRGGRRGNGERRPPRDGGGRQ